MNPPTPASLRDIAQWIRDDAATEDESVRNFAASVAARLSDLVPQAGSATDQRVEALRGLVANLREYPADQSEEVLAEASVLAAELKGLADMERLTRALYPAVLPVPQPEEQP